MNRRLLILLIFLLNLAGWLVIIEFNNLIALYHIHLHLEVIPILFAAFYFPPLPGMILAGGFGFFIGATRPVSIGFTLLSFLALWLAGVWMRRRLHRESALHLTSFAAGAQFLLLAVYALLLYPDTGIRWSSYLQRISVDSALSAAAAALVAVPWCRFQVRLLGGFGWDLEHETAHKS